MGIIVDATEITDKTIKKIYRIQESIETGIYESEDLDELKEELISANKKVWETLLMCVETVMNQNKVIIQFMGEVCENGKKN